MEYICFCRYRYIQSLLLWCEYIYVNIFMICIEYIQFLDYLFQTVRKPRSTSICFFLLCEYLEKHVYHSTFYIVCRPSIILMWVCVCVCTYIPSLSLSIRLSLSVVSMFNRKERRNRHNPWRHSLLALLYMNVCIIHANPFEWCKQALQRILTSIRPNRQIKESWGDRKSVV